MTTFQVIGVNGQEILDAMTLAPSTPVSDVQTLVREALGIPFQVVLLHEYEELPRLANIGECLEADQCNLLMAVAQTLPDDERARFLEKLSKCSYGVEDLFKSLPDEAKGDEELVMAFVKADGRVFQHVHQSLLQDRSIVLTAVRKNRRALAISHSAFRKDKEIVLAAAASFGDTLIYADKNLFWDSDFLQEVVSCNKNALTTLKTIGTEIEAKPLVELLSRL